MFIPVKWCTDAWTIVRTRRLEQIITYIESHLNILLAALELVAVELADVDVGAVEAVLVWYQMTKGEGRGAARVAGSMNINKRLRASIVVEVKKGKGR